ncbi:DUF7146 domain-containing protein [Bradyrhizobium sp. DASA03068]|uniref:DUF7146 domain-containing protein n=1 Tax=Bradyrhizobium sp. BLXBL-01 TaxID=3395915 RepID=UPI003F6FB2E3
MSPPITGTLVGAYLRNRGITALHETGCFRFHPRCYHRPDDPQPDRDPAGDDRRRPDLRGHLTGAHRTWLDPGGFSETTLGKARIDTPKRGGWRPAWSRRSI